VLSKVSTLLRVLLGPHLKWTASIDLLIQENPPNRPITLAFKGSSLTLLRLMFKWCSISV
jgi:hypothetical protein